MKKNFGKQTYLYPMPVLIIATYDEDGNADAMNAAWGGIHDTNQIGICISPEHKTAKNLLDKDCLKIYFKPISVKYFFAPGWNGTETPVTAAFAETSLPFACAAARLSRFSNKAFVI